MLRSLLELIYAVVIIHIEHSFQLAQQEQPHVLGTQQIVNGFMPHVTLDTSWSQLRTVPVSHHDMNVHFSNNFRQNQTICV